MEDRNEGVSDCDQALSSCDEAFDAISMLNGEVPVISSFLKNMTDDCSLCSLDMTEDCSLCSLDLTGDGFTEDCCGADGSICAELESLSVAEREDDDIVDYGNRTNGPIWDTDIVDHRGRKKGILRRPDLSKPFILLRRSELPKLTTRKVKFADIQEDCCGADGTEVERNVLGACWGVEDRSDGDEIVDNSKNDVPEVRSEVDDENSIVDIALNEWRDRNAVNHRNNTIAVKSHEVEDKISAIRDTYRDENTTPERDFASEYAVNDYNSIDYTKSYEIYQDVYRDEVETPKSNYGFDKQNDEEYTAKDLKIVGYTKSYDSETHNDRNKFANQDDEEYATNNYQNNISYMKSYEIYEDIYCVDEEPPESGYECTQCSKCARPIVSPLKEQRFRSGEKKSKNKPQMQNSVALKRQRASLQLQKRLEKIYYREKMIRDLDMKLAAWKKPKNKRASRDEMSVSDSISRHSVKTGLEVMRMEL